MKLRLRSLESKETLKLEVPNTCTVRELKEILSSRISNVGSSSSIPHDQLFLTLNRNDELSGSSLQSVGVTSGDLIFYTLNPNSDDSSSSHIVNPQNQIDNLGKLCAANAPVVGTKNIADDGCKIEELVDNPQVVEKETLDLSTSRKRPSLTEEEENSGVEADGFGNMDIDDDDVAILRSLSAPSFLKKVFEDEIGSSSSSNGSDNMLLKVAVHAVLLESGFVGYNPVSCTKLDGFRLPDSFLSSPLHYTIPEALSSQIVQSVSIKFQNLGKFVNVNGSLTNKFICRVSLDVLRFAPAFNLVWKNGNNDHSLTEKIGVKNPENDVFEFWKLVKDGIALPLLINLCETIGITPPSCFMLLHTDLKLKILELLPGIDIAKVACVCNELRFVCSNDELWKLKYEQEFGNAVETEDPDSWKRRFSRVLVKRRKIEMELVRRRVTRVPGIIPHYPFMGQDPSFPFPAPFGGPRIIGGDYDIYGVPHILPFPFGRRRRPMYPNCNVGGFNP